MNVSRDMVSSAPTESTAGESGLTSTVYGPVHSWRVGSSLGIDLLFVNSICSFRCVYCQLGAINVHTDERRVFASTMRVLDDLKASNWRDVDVITLSGSGEPTLALNLGEVIRGIKTLTAKPVVVLTNATKLNDAAVRCDLTFADKVFCKLDAADERTFRMVARPFGDVTLGSVIQGIKKFRAEYKGHLAIQIMLMRIHRNHGEAFARLLNEIRPDEVQLNTASRPIPRGWFPQARGNDALTPRTVARAKTLSSEEARLIESQIRTLTNFKIISASPGCAGIWPATSETRE